MMEVHAHSHTARKKWTHYFWEFLMLFLAVFCGFLAENQREHYIEHQREKEFMRSMLSDLQADTANLESMHRTFSNITLHIDSLIPLLQERRSFDKNAKEIYQQQIFLNFYNKWTYSDRTINQLKNSGNFRLIRNKKISNLIMGYDGYVRSFVGDMQDMYILPHWRRINDGGTDIFKSSVFRNYLKGGAVDSAIQLPGEPYFISTEVIKIQIFINMLEQYAVAVDWFNININNAVKTAVHLDSAIRKEYHLE